MGYFYSSIDSFCIETVLVKICVVQDPLSDLQHKFWGTIIRRAIQWNCGIGLALVSYLQGICICTFDEFFLVHLRMRGFLIEIAPHHYRRLINGLALGSLLANVCFESYS